MKQIQVHGVDVEGNKFIINRFTSENMEADFDPAKRKALQAKALKAAFDWSKVYPSDKFIVVEV